MSDATEPGISSATAETQPIPTKTQERRVFILLAVFLAPILSVVLVGGYGFLIWMSQLAFGPPTQ
ncbi:MAG: periplasmic nitrate reductase, NapE protein [Rhizobiaceae bacterium]